MENKFNIVNGTLVSYSGDERNIIVPDSVEAIGDNCFENSRISSIKLPAGLKAIGFRAFINCKALSDIIIPNTVERIGSKAFMNCINLEEVKLSKNIESIPYRCFFGCTSIRDITIPEGVRTIESDAFAGCDNMIYVVFPFSLRSVGFMAFQKMGVINDKNKIYIVDRFYYQRKVEIAVGAFENNHPLLTGNIFQIPELFKGNIKLTIKTDNTVLKDELITRLMLDDLGKNSEDDISWDEEKEWRNSVCAVDFINAPKLNIIESNVFAYCHNLKDIENIPQTLVNIGKEAFRETAIRNLVLPKKLKALGDYCFIHCRKLIGISIPKSLEKIGEGSFLGCISLQKIYYDGTKQEWLNIEKGKKWDGASEYGTDVQAAVICKDGVLYLNGK